MVCFASTKCGFWTGRDLHTHLRTQSNLRTSLPCTTSLVVATLRMYTHMLQSNLRASLRSYVTDRSGSKQYRTISAVRFVKSFRSDAGGLASLGRRGLSVRHRRTRFARPPIGVRRDRLSIRTGRYVTLLHTIKSEDLTPFLRKLRNWSFRIKGVPQRPAVKDINRKSRCETYIYIHSYIQYCTYIHT